MRLIPLGGLGEFGANAMLLEDENGESVLLDAGAAFSDLELFGVSYEVPDFATLAAPPRALLLTHGHDDHLKGATHLWEAFPQVPAFGSPATVARLKLSGVGDGGATSPTQVFPAQGSLSVGSWQVDALGVSHSIPGTVLLRLCGPAGTVVAATDFRLSPSALEEVTPLHELARWGGDGVDLVLLDATNALVFRPPPDEAQVAATLAELVAQTRGAVVGVIFASHAGRFLQFAQAAVACGRVVVPVGRGLEEMLAVQAAVGGFRLPPGTVRAARELARLPRERLVIVSTGSQGESGAAFTRLALDALPGFRLHPEDLVVHAARLVPGHERRVAKLLDHCARRGARVVTAEQAPVHASGHPHREELDRVLEVLRPRWVLPVHGGRRHLEEAATLARRHGCGTMVVENGQAVRWRDGEPRQEEGYQGVGRVLVGDDSCAAVNAALLQQRRQVARNGLVAAVIPTVGRGEGGVGEPQLMVVGLALADGERRRLLVGLGEELRRAQRQGCTDKEELRSTMSRWLRSELRRRQGCRPAVLVAVVGP